MVLVSTAFLLWGLVFLLSIVVASTVGLGSYNGCSSECMRVGLLQFGKHFDTVLGGLQFTLELFDLVKDHLSEIFAHNVNDFLKNVVAKDMSHKFPDNPSQTNVDNARVLADLVDDCLIIPEMGAFENLGNLVWSLSGLKALFNHI